MGDAIFLGLVFAGSVAGSVFYGRHARRIGVVATPNFRTLHEAVVPRGGGIGFGAIFVIAIISLWASDRLPTALMLAIGVGGGIATAIGFIDDVHDIRAIVKLCLQVGLSVWFLVMAPESPLLPPFHGLSGALDCFVLFVALFLPVWMINLFNFIDGIDGMAISASVFVCTAAFLILLVTDGDKTLGLVVALLGTASLGFAAVNLPPARVFMGDAGSIFLGYVIGALLLTTVSSGQISIWTWLTILAYFVADTTTTTLCRIALVRKWYGAHRSHAYQNLARILKSHSKVTYGVLLYNLLWVLPLAIWSARAPAWGPLTTLLSLGPAVLWTLRFGPRLSST